MFITETKVNPIQQQPPLKRIEISCKRRASESKLKQTWWWKKRLQDGCVQPPKGYPWKEKGGKIRAAPPFPGEMVPWTKRSGNSHPQGTCRERGWLAALVSPAESSPARQSSHLLQLVIFACQTSSCQQGNFREFTTNSREENTLPPCHNYHSMLSAFHLEHKLIKWHFSSSVSDDFE